MADHGDDARGAGGEVGRKERGVVGAVVDGEERGDGLAAGRLHAERADRLRAEAEKKAETVRCTTPNGVMSIETALACTSPYGPLAVNAALVPRPETSVMKKFVRKLSPWNAAAKVTGKRALAAA